MKKGSETVVWAFLRVSTARQDIESQRNRILEYANDKGWQVQGFFETTISSRLMGKKRSITEFREQARDGKFGIVLFSELSRFGRSVGEIARLVDEFVEQYGVELHFIKENMILRKGKRDMSTKVMLTMFSLFAEIERDLISERTKDALAARKEQGVKLGRPKGKSKLDLKEDEIRHLIDLGVVQKKVAMKFGCTEATLSKWLSHKRKQWKNEKK
ncbi:MAG: recombinase family protein [Phycisphaerae bacterium]|nr:recombinase family protein [Phycisphaerae bacterium]